MLRVADRDEVPMEALREFAALTLQCELVQLAQRLQEAPPEFAVRRGMELASLVLTWGTKLQTAEGPSPADAASEGTASTARLVAGEGSPE